MFSMIVFTTKQGGFHQKSVESDGDGRSE